MTDPTFASPQAVQAALAEVGYLASGEIATTAFLAARLEKPVLVEGPAGVGKTELARSLSQATGRELVRLQCYEGLDEAKALYEWAYAKQLLYSQLLKEKIDEVVGDVPLAEAVERVAAVEELFFSERFLLPRPLLRALTSDRPVVLLVDEVDRADPEFEAFLLEVLADYAVTVPELGTLSARHPPFVVLTSNDTREMSDALRRRCLHLGLDYPDADRERRILEARIPGIEASLARRLAEAVAAIRRLDLKKPPSVSETLDWARALLVMGASSLDPGLVEETLDVLLKYRGDVARVKGDLGQLLGTDA